ncbi:hypothetical protein CC78DRAFT_263481 [Lojkania enalia]|uniref:Uncharacterized protein n=1 Tax=Lojkania enalia TaxID=147567 RepID=A0A9P4N872_9PLEO|nr:hypothetical protein CC78DRAFT_263481 [Didymosphaeria enalia]
MPFTYSRGNAPQYHPRSRQVQSQDLRSFLSQILAIIEGPNFDPEMDCFGSPAPRYSSREAYHKSDVERKVDDKAVHDKLVDTEEVNDEQSEMSSDEEIDEESEKSSDEDEDKGGIVKHEQVPRTSPSPTTESPSPTKQALDQRSHAIESRRAYLAKKQNAEIARKAAETKMKADDEFTQAMNFEFRKLELQRRYKERGKEEAERIQEEQRRKNAKKRLELDITAKTDGLQGDKEVVPTPSPEKKAVAPLTSKSVDEEIARVRSLIQPTGTAFIRVVECYFGKVHKTSPQEQKRLNRIVRGICDIKQGILYLKK